MAKITTLTYVGPKIKRTTLVQALNAFYGLDHSDRQEFVDRLPGGNVLKHPFIVRVCEDLESQLAKFDRSGQVRTKARKDYVAALRDKEGLSLEDIFSQHKDELRALNRGKPVSLATLNGDYYPRKRKETRKL